MNRADSWRFLLISTQRDWGGGEQQLQLLAQGLEHRGHSVVLVAGRDSEVAERMASAGLTVELLSARGRSLLGWWQLRRLDRTFRPHVVYLNDPHAVTAWWLAGRSKALRLAARRVAFPLRSPAKYRRATDVLICVSEAVRRQCELDGLDAQRLQIIHDGVDPARVAGGCRARGRQRLGLPTDWPLLLCIAKLTPCKGHRFLLESLPAIVSRWPNVQLALAGDGELREALSQQVDRLGIGAHVHMLGFRNDIADLLAAADLFVLPSTSEGFGSSLVDAMLAGCPIVSTRAGGIPDVLEADGDTASEPLAWLVAPADSGALGMAIQEALASRDERSRRATRARERALGYFTAQRMVDSTLEVVMQRLEGGLRRSA